MIYVRNTKDKQTAFFPCTGGKIPVVTIAWKNNLKGEIYNTFPESGAGDMTTRDFYVLAFAFPADLQPGEYTYMLFDVDNNVLEHGLARVGEIVNEGENNNYSKYEDFVIYDEYKD